MANNIGLYRRIAKVSQEKLAQRCQVSQPTIHKYENGYSEPPEEMKKRIARVLEVPYDYLFGKLPVDLPPSDPHICPYAA